MKKLIFGLIFILLMGFGMSASSEPTYCCEKTTAGAWCANDVESACDLSYNAAPTSCETTSYCKLGTCYDSEEGICMGNTPQRVCNDNGGTWDERELNAVPQCQLGCCVISDQAAFVSLTRCKKLSTFFGVENDYRTDITNEISCIAEAQSQDVGACVYEEEFERLCEFTTRGDCGAGEKVEVLNQTNITLNSQRTFYQDFLCSAEELSTSCARQTSTTCDGGDVYWVDSCGNLENVYSSDKDSSWNNGRVAEASEVCAANDGSNIDCGNCDYMLGTRCATKDGVFGGIRSQVIGNRVDHYCQKTECVDREGRERINGESWCVYDKDSDSGISGAGARDYREICVDGDVKVEPCADFRNEICLEDSIDTSSGPFETAACRVNRWQDCIRQVDMDDCLNTDRRDCKWLPSVIGMILGGSVGGQGSGVDYSNPSASGDMFSNPTASPITGNVITNDDGEQSAPGTNRPDGVCVPNYAPGLEFWKEGSAKAICGQASAECVVVYEKGLIDSSPKCIEGCECLEDAWAEGANRVCSALGDCGGAVNYVGDYTDDGYKWVVDGAEKEL